MKSYITFLKISMFLWFALYTIAWCASISPSDISIENRTLIVKTPHGNTQKIPVDHDLSISDVTLENLTFGKYAAIKILNDEGASQKYYKVFLYNEDNDDYVYSDDLSNVPCLQVGRRKNEIIGACFHENSCENWVETYRVNKTGKLTITERKGTYCDSSGKIYSYVDGYKNGKMISSKVKLGK